MAKAVFFEVEFPWEMDSYGYEVYEKFVDLEKTMDFAKAHPGSKVYRYAVTEKELICDCIWDYWDHHDKWNYHREKMIAQ